MKKLSVLALLGITTNVFAQTVNMETLNDILGAVSQTDEAKVFSETFTFKKVTAVDGSDGFSATITGKADFVVASGLPECGEVSLIIERHQDYRMIKTYTAKIDTSLVSAESFCQKVMKQILDRIKH